MTLVELLVVIAILVMLAGVMVPVMRPALEGRRIREASRGVNVALSAARNRAMSLGRPVGVMIHRFSPALPTAAMRLDEVEMPPPYAGDTLDSKASVCIISSNPPIPDRWPDGTLKLEAQIVSGIFNSTIVNQGDEIQFNEMGPRYTIENLAGTNTLELSLDDSTGQVLGWPMGASVGAAGSLPMPYKIYRQPVNPLNRAFATSASRTFQLPAGAVIDLAFSGTEYNPTLFQNTNLPDLDPVVIMFSPNGGVDRLYYTDGSGVFDHVLAVEPIYLLVGKREQLSGLTPSQLNWEDLENRWVSINPRTGMVTTSVMVQAANVSDARQMARTGRQMGGG